MQQTRRLAALSLALILSACGRSATTINSGNDINTAMIAEEFNDGLVLDNGEGANTVPPPPEPACATPPANGAVLEGQRFAGEGHELIIENGAGGDAIIKIRNADTGRLVTSFFVTQNNSATVGGIPDGNYVFQYAFGAPLAEDCKSFANITSADEFPGTRSFATEEVDTAEGPRLRGVRLSFTLFSVPQGNIQPNPINQEAFNRP